uniref:TNFR-Cys domain-containing protein n=1 Tax=Seriola lalandi dorsalis TaxID=1841481 RepID=A0A3B4YCX7_SERLL
MDSLPTCDPTEFLLPNSTCVACPVCGPGEQLSQDCGFGDGGEGVCILCEEGKFSSNTGVDPCRRCTQCNLLNRLEKTACSLTNDALCGQCLPGYYELRSLTGEVEPPCVPCYGHDKVHKECLLFTAQGSKASKTQRQTMDQLTDIRNSSTFVLPSCLASFLCHCQLEQKLQTIWEMAQGMYVFLKP